MKIPSFTLLKCSCGQATILIPPGYSEFAGRLLRFKDVVILRVLEAGDRNCMCCHRPLQQAQVVNFNAQDSWRAAELHWLLDEEFSV